MFRSIRKRFVLTAEAAAVLAVPGAAVALEAGDVAPPFTLPGSDGQTHSLADLAGRHVVLAFFPKAFTGG